MGLPSITSPILNPSGVNLLPGLTVKTVIPTGDSQSASRLSTYINSVHPLNPIFGGFFLHSSLGNAIRTDLGNVKVFKYLTESDVLVLGEAAVRRPDTPTFVTWETAGTSHADYWGLLNSQAIRARDATPYPMNPPCPYQLTRSRILSYRGQDAAYDHMVQWIQNNVQPPSGPRLELSQITPSVVPVRDSNGNIIGGIRLADFAVPISTDTGYNVNTPAAPGILCFVLGQYIPFSQQMLNRLYPNHGSYILKTAAAAAGNVADGYMLPDDEGDANATAAESDIGGTQLKALNLAGINFEGISVPNAALTSDNLSGANLSDGNLQGVSLQGANLRNVNFTNANLEGAQLQGANLQGAIWSNTTCPDGTNSNQNVGFSCSGHLGS
jgi:Alpha/beta hydrolase domain/Pentapeptide repeats (8 copies)